MIENARVTQMWQEVTNLLTLFFELAWSVENLADYVRWCKSLITRARIVHEMILQINPSESIVLRSPVEIPA